MFCRLRLCFFAGLSLILGSVVPLVAQTASPVSGDGCTVHSDRPAHTLTGSVVDASGARVPSANVTNLIGTRYVATRESTSRCVYGQSRSIFAKVNYQW